MDPNTGILFTMPTFVEGVARAVDVGDTLTVYNISASPEEADLRAIRADWLAVGNDLRRVMRRYKRKLKRARNARVQRQTQP